MHGPEFVLALKAGRFGCLGRNDRILMVWVKRILAIDHPQFLAEISFHLFQFWIIGAARRALKIGKLFDSYGRGGIAAYVRRCCARRQRTRWWRRPGRRRARLART